MTRATRRALGGVLVLTLALAAPAQSREITHRVAPGETLSDIAKQYYGSTERARILQLYNRLESLQIQAGRDLRIPLVDEHSVAAGETWSDLAERYWGDATLHRELARATAGGSRATLRSGQKLIIPVLVPYRLQRGETLVAVARRFFGRPDQAQSLARINGIRNPRRLQVGERLLIPRSDLSLARRIPARPARAPETPSVSAPPPPKRPAAEPPNFGGELRRAINSYLDGNYQGALEKLEEVRPRVLARGRAAERKLLLRHLIFVYTAFDRQADACTSYRALLQLDPQFDWDPDEVSPKILGLVARCKRG